MDILQLIAQPWHWAFSGFMLVVVMFLLIYLGRRFGISSSFRTVCSIGGAGKRFEYFDYNWRKQSWLLLLVLGAILGGAFSSKVIPSPEPVKISQATINDLHELGIHTPRDISEGSGMIPLDLFNFNKLATPQGLIMMVLGGFFVGFGTRWAGGCTSGHAISGLSELQLPSLVAVIGFFVGGLVTTFLIFPVLFQ